MKVFRNIFLDTNVVFDVFDKKTAEINRYNAKLILQQVIEKKYTAYISPLSFLLTNYFIVKQNSSEKEALKKIQTLESITKITAINHVIVKKALYSHLHDFEDALQYYSAEAEAIDVIITRDAHDFYKIKIPVLSPSEFLQNINSKQN
jgi:predicted nucleic acid-binding protein